MNLNIPISEAEALIATKTGKSVSLQVIDEKTIRAIYSIKVKLLGTISKISLDLTIDKIIGETLYLSFKTTGIGIDLILKGLLKALPSFCGPKMLENNAPESLIVHLDEIPKVHNTLQNVDITAIKFLDDKAVAEFNMK